MTSTLKPIIILFYISTITCYGYHQTSPNLSKTDFSNSKWRTKTHFPTKNPHLNHKQFGNNHHRLYVSTTENPYNSHRIRHGGYVTSRYSSLDNFMNRLDRFRYGYLAAKKPKWDSHRTNSHGSDSVESYFGENYDENDYKDDDLDEGFDEDNLDADYDDDDLEDKQSDIQAEEARGNEGSFTAAKWEQFGTMDRVHQNRKKHMQANSNNNGAESAAGLVMEHFKKVTKAAECSTPVPKVIAVQKVHPNPGKSYIPHCTILHRCSEDTGCCHDPTKQCGPKSQVLIHLYFYVKFQDVTKTEKLAFANHTACGCIDRNLINSTEFQIEDVNTIEPPMNLRSAPEYQRRCKCPTEYIPSYKYNKCSCVCLEGSIDCDRMKKGKEYISLKDRICIKNGICTIPFCDYGSYLKELGRCPKKQEK